MKRIIFIVIVIMTMVSWSTVSFSEEKTYKEHFSIRYKDVDMDFLDTVDTELVYQVYPLEEGFCIFVGNKDVFVGECNLRLKEQKAFSKGFSSVSLKFESGYIVRGAGEIGIPGHCFEYNGIKMMTDKMICIEDVEILQQFFSNDSVTVSIKNSIVSSDPHVCKVDIADIVKTQSESVSSCDINVGDSVLFGRYPQTANGTDETPIEWIVLDMKDDHVLLISRYGLDAQPYHNNYVNISWEKCSLRKWLNSVFINAAFNGTEQSEILMSTVDNSTSQGNWNVKGGENTQDKIFLLSYAEANEYFGVAYYGFSPEGEVELTPYASNCGATIEWWLRSPGAYASEASTVKFGGILETRNITNAKNCVRPAIWVSTSSSMFNK